MTDINNTNQDKQKLYNAVNYLTLASQELQEINGLLSFSILAQAEVILAHLKYLETGNFEYSLTNLVNVDNQEIKITDDVRDEIDKLSKELEGSL